MFWAGFRTAAIASGLSFSCIVAHAEIRISKQPTKNMSCADGVCTPTANHAVLNVSDLTNMLASGDLTVQSGNGDKTAAGIEIVNGFSWTSANRLTLSVKHNITISAPVTVAGTGALTIAYNDGGTGGDLRFFDKGKVSFWDTSSSLIINGDRYMLLADIGTLAKEVRAHPTGRFALAKDYDASVDGQYSAPPISANFAGSLEGLAHEITNFSMLVQSGKCLGLIKETEGTAILRDIALTNAEVFSEGNSEYSQLGTLVGCNEGTVLNARAAGSASGSQLVYVGGLVGLNLGGLISNSAANVAVTSNYAGGLVGRNAGTILGSVATGQVIAAVRGGGLAVSNGSRHYHHSGQILLSHAGGQVSATGSGANGGGLVAVNLGGSEIDQSYASASVDSNGCGGGLVGCYEYKSYRSGEISNSYAIGAVAGSSAAGGLQGSKTIYGTTVTSYSVGAVTGATLCSGGVLACAKGKAREELEKDYWDIDTSGTNVPCGRRADHPLNCPGATGLTDAQLKSGLPDGFDPKIWGQSPNINNGYPYLLANPPPQ